MDETRTNEPARPQEGTKKPVGTCQDWFWVLGLICMLVGAVVPQHFLAHKPLVLFAAVLCAAGKYPSYLSAVFLLLGLALAVDWMHLVPGKFSLLLLLPSLAVGVFGFVRERRKRAG